MRLVGGLQAQDAPAAALGVRARLRGRDRRRRSTTPASRSAPSPASGACAGRCTSSRPRTRAGSWRCSGRSGWRAGAAAASRWASAPRRRPPSAPRSPTGRAPATRSPTHVRAAGHRLEDHPQAAIHLVMSAAAEGHVIEAAWRGREPTYALTDDWLGPAGPLPDRETALAELARRHARAHPPAGPEDLAAWSGLPMRDARAAFAAIAPELEEVEVLGRRAWVPRGLEPAPAGGPPAPGLRRHPARPPRPRAHRPPRARPRRPPRRRHPAPDRARRRARRGHLALRARHAGGHAVRPAGARRRGRDRRRGALPRGVKFRRRGPIVSCGGHEDAHHGGRVPRDGRGRLEGRRSRAHRRRDRHEPADPVAPAGRDGDRDRPRRVGEGRPRPRVRLPPARHQARRVTTSTPQTSSGTRKVARPQLTAPRPYPPPDLVVEIRSPSTWRLDIGPEEGRLRGDGRPRAVARRLHLRARLPPLRAEAPRLRRHARADARGDAQLPAAAGLRAPARGPLPAA